MPVHGLLVESVDLRRLGGSAVGNDFVGDTFDWRLLTPGEKNARPRAGKSACDSASSSASRSVDDGDLVIQQPVRCSLSMVGSTDLSRV
jgi:hypothetical protein